MTSLHTIPPVRRSIHVRCDPGTAFRAFTREIGSWWPLEQHAVDPAEVRDVVFEERVGGEVYEVSASGARAHWADVVAREPPHRLAIAWRVSPEAASATDIEVSFVAEQGGTRVELVHSGWERLGENGAASRTNYADGWKVVLGCFEAAFG